jgi:hypothetical protein
MLMGARWAVGAAVLLRPGWPRRRPDLISKGPVAQGQVTEKCMLNPSEGTFWSPCYLVDRSTGGAAFPWRWPCACSAGGFAAAALSWLIRPSTAFSMLWAFCSAHTLAASFAALCFSKCMRPDDTNAQRLIASAREPNP